jgi:asparagine synthase (glutamine-hydrolysing)
MCGICGILGVEDVALARRMADAITHRGIDDEGHFAHDGVSLGFRRLSIIDVAGGHQPIFNEEGDKCVIHNGEIYNHEELRRELEAAGHDYRTRSDAETILHAYEEWGPDCVSRFNGMFAFAIWDGSRRELFLARDRLGIKPLYHARVDGRFLFASEPKAIMEYEGYIPRPDPTAIHNFLKFRFNNSLQSVYAGIRKLAPGSTMTVGADGRRETRRYWEVNIAVRDSPPEALAKELRELLLSSVRYRLMSEVPLGVYLSGGIDSGSVAGLMSQVADDVRTFSVGFGGHFEEDPHYFDELRFARLVSEHFGTDHKEIIMEPDAIDLLQQVIWHLDEPMSDLAVIPVFVLSREAKKEVTVILTGDGNDEVWAGYDKYELQLKLDAYRKMVPGLVKKALPALRGILPDGYVKARLGHSQMLLEEGGAVLHHSSVFDDWEEDALFTREFKSQVGGPTPREVVIDPYFGGDHDFLNKMLWSDVRTLLVDSYLVKTDRMCMAHSVENRVPLIDHRIVEFAFTVPPRYKLRNGVEKWLFKEAVKDLVPPEIVRRKKKGFNVPVHYWLKSNPELVDLLDERAIRKRGYFNYPYVQKVLSHLKDPDPNQAQRIWSLITLEIWHQQLDERAAG